MDEDPIQRAAAMPPPTVAEAIVLLLVEALAEEKPKRLRRVVARALGRAANAKVRRLHEDADDPAWGAAYEGAAARLGALAEMVRREHPRKKVKKRQR